jgi:hypothetical protein
MTEKLKPCPFCGGVKVSAEYCANDKVAESWNRRVNNG